MGPSIDTFTGELQSYFQSPCLLTNSGTSAIHLALQMAGVEEGDRVLCSNFTFAASAFPILYQKAKPVFVGVERDRWNIHPEFLKQAIFQSPQPPKALILTHVYGMPAAMDEILKICNEHHITLIEDAAEAMGSRYQEQLLGTFGQSGVISFNGNKIITTSSGGLLLSPNQDKINQAKKIASQAKENSHYYQHAQLGFNYLMSNILAAVGSAQFQSLEEKIEKRRATFMEYSNALKQLLPTFTQKEDDKCFSNRWLSSFYWEEDLRDTFYQALQKEQIESRFLFNPLNRQKVFKDFDYFGDDWEALLFQKGLSLPSGHELSASQQMKIMNILNNSV